MPTMIPPVDLPLPDSKRTHRGVMTQSTADFRRHVEYLADMSSFLPQPDRFMMEQIWLHGLPATEVAEGLGRPSRSVQRKVARLAMRLRTPLFRFVATHLDALPREYRSVARYHVLHGRSLRDTAERTQLSLHRVRETVRVLKAMCIAAR